MGLHHTASEATCNHQPCDFSCLVLEFLFYFYTSLISCQCFFNIFIYDLVPKGVHENRTKGVENKVDDTLKLVVFLDWAQC